MICLNIFRRAVKKTGAQAWFCLHWTVFNGLFNSTTSLSQFYVSIFFRGLILLHKNCSFHEIRILGFVQTTGIVGNEIIRIMKPKPFSFYKYKYCMSTQRYYLITIHAVIESHLPWSGCNLSFPYDFSWH